MSEQQLTAGASERDHLVRHGSRGRGPTAHLPPWESFANADRQRLVQTILYAAQRHLATVQVRGEQELGR